MDNYLSSRWPKGPGVQPPPVPSMTAPPPPAPKRKRSPRRWVVAIVCIVLCLALLGGISFWAVKGIVELIESVQRPDSSADSLPRPSWSIPRDPDWSQEDLPWGEPDPSVQLSVEPAAGAVLSGRDIHQQVMPSIVYVEAQQKTRFGTSVHSGTGIIVTESGYVITNYHVIDESNTVQVMLLTDWNTYYDAKVIGIDEEFDVAVLKIEAEGLVPAPLGDSDALAVGDKVYAEGNPMGYLLGTMTDGIVSALEREDDENGGMTMIQTSAALNPGNSGGALVNEWGQVVGITSAKITGLVSEYGEDIEDAAVIENIGLAIPTSDILPFLNRILATGRSWRPSIGITCSEAVEDGRRGIRVAEVEQDAPAREAGLKTGDLIVSANGTPVGSLTELRREIYSTGVDGMLHCVVVRDGEEIDLSFALIDKYEASDE